MMTTIPNMTTTLAATQTTTYLPNLPSNLNPKMQIYEFFLFNRSGVCLLHIDFQEETLSIKNKALQNNRDNENRHKLIFGLIFSMKSFIKTLSPIGNLDFFKNYSTSNYKLHYVEFLNGVRFVLLTSQIKMDLSPNLKDIFNIYYVNLISKNILINKDEIMKNDLFIESVYLYLNNLNGLLN